MPELFGTALTRQELMRRVGRISQAAGIRRAMLLDGVEKRGGMHRDTIREAASTSPSCRRAENEGRPCGMARRAARLDRRLRRRRTRLI